MTWLKFNHFCDNACHSMRVTRCYANGKGSEFIIPCARIDPFFVRRGRIAIVNFMSRKEQNNQKRMGRLAALWYVRNGQLTRGGAEPWLLGKDITGAPIYPSTKHCQEPSIRVCVSITYVLQAILCYRGVLFLFCTIL